jgi:hypothetical protein
MSGVAMCTIFISKIKWFNLRKSTPRIEWKRSSFSIISAFCSGTRSVLKLNRCIIFLKTEFNSFECYHVRRHNAWIVFSPIKSSNLSRKSWSLYMSTYIWYTNNELFLGILRAQRCSFSFLNPCLRNKTKSLP